jgi:hypothetical protein
MRPLPVTRRRFLAELFVFIFGMEVKPQSKQLLEASSQSFSR